MPGPKIACSGHRSDGADDLVLVGALEEVAARPGLHGGEHRGVVVVHREHQHRRLRRGLAHAPGRADTVEHWHPDVDEQHIGPRQLDLADRALTILGLPHDLDAVDGRQQGSQATADDRVVVGDHDTDRHAPMMAARLPSGARKFFPELN